MPEPSASVSNAAAQPLPPTGTSPAEGQTGSAGATKSPAKAKSEVANVTGEGEAPAKQETALAPDEEFDIDGEKIPKSKLFEHFKRQKEFERASHKRMQEAAETRKLAAQKEAEIEAAFARLNDDPYAVYRARGFSDEQIDQIAEQRLMQRMQRAQMTPEQLEAERMRTQFQQTQRELQTLKQQQEQQKQQALQQKYYEHFDQQIAQAMEIGNLARTASTGAKVAAVMAEYLQAGEVIEPALAAQIVRDNHQTEIRHEFTDIRQQLNSGRITPEKFLGYVSDLIGPDTIKLIQQAGVRKAQDFEPQKPRNAVKPTAQPKKAFDSFDEANAWISKRINHG